MKTFFKLVREISEYYSIGTSMENKFWIKSYSIQQNCGHEVIVARVYDIVFFNTIEELQKCIKNDIETNRNRAPHDQIKHIFKKKIEFNEDFIQEVKKAQETCKLFGEFNFTTRKAFRQKTVSELGTDRDKKDFIKWVLSSY